MPFVRCSVDWSSAYRPVPTGPLPIVQCLTDWLRAHRPVPFRLVQCPTSSAHCSVLHRLLQCPIDWFSAHRPVPHRQVQCQSSSASPTGPVPIVQCLTDWFSANHPVPYRLVQCPSSSVSPTGTPVPSLLGGAKGHIKSDTTGLTEHKRKCKRSPLPERIPQSTRRNKIALKLHQEAIFSLTKK